MKSLKYIVSLIVLFAAFNLNAQNYFLDYTQQQDPFEWKILRIEKHAKKKETAILISVRNTSGEDQKVPYGSTHIADLGGDRVYKVFPKSNTHYGGVTDEITLGPGKHVELYLTFPTLEFFDSEDLTIIFGGKYYLREINFQDIEEIVKKSEAQEPLPPVEIKKTETAEVNNESLNVKNSSKSTGNFTRQTAANESDSWENFYKDRKVARLTYKDLNEIYAVVEEDLEKWSARDEFETTSAWKKRVTDKTKKEHKDAKLLELVNQHEKELAKIQEEESLLRAEYEKRQAAASEAAAKKDESDNVSSTTADLFVLMSYDADNEIYKINSSKYGEIQLNVPLEEARDFKANWNKIREGMKLEFVPDGDDIKLSQIIFINGTKTYKYVPAR